MIEPTFTFEADSNGYLSEPFTVGSRATVCIELASSAPVVTLKKESDDSWVKYGQTPRQETAFKITITTNRDEQVRLATPVAVKKCYVLN